MTDSEPIPPQTAHSSEPQSTRSTPKLWNPGATASWSLLFSPVFGAFLQMKNWQELGEHERARKSKSWAIVSAAFFVVAVLLTIVAPNPKLADGVSRFFGLVLLITWYYANGKYQQAYVAARFGKTYAKRGWTKPLLLAVAAVIAFMFVMGVIGFLMEFANEATG